MWLFRWALLLLDASVVGQSPENPELARLMTEARTDNLTRLANHRAFHDDLAAEIDRRNRTGSVFSLMAVDLDGLKSINDSLGHQAGDAHIVRLGHALRDQTGAAGTVYRTGGDEFMILLRDRRNWHAIDLAHRIHAATASDDGTRALSIGVTETQGTEHRQALIRQADLALYEAKRAKLAVVPFRHGMDPVGLNRPARRRLAAAARARRGACPHRRRARPRHEQPLRDGGRARGRDRRSTSGSPAAASSGSGSRRSSTTSGRSRCPTRSCTSPSRSPRKRWR